MGYDPGVSVVCVNYEPAWAAGFFDGEGNINAFMPRNRKRYTLQLSVTQIHPETLDRFRKAVGMTAPIYGPYDTKTGRSAQWQVKVTGEEALRVFECLRSWLTPVKLAQGDEAIARFRSTPPRLMDMSEAAQRRRARKRDWDRRRRGVGNG